MRLSTHPLLRSAAGAIASGLISTERISRRATACGGTLVSFSRRLALCEGNCMQPPIIAVSILLLDSLVDVPFPATGNPVSSVACTFPPEKA